MADGVILAKLSQLRALGEKFNQVTGELTQQIGALEEAGGQANVLERLKVNGQLLTPDENKTVDIPVPTRVGQLENDAGYQENVLEKICVNGAEQNIQDGKGVDLFVPTKVSDLVNDDQYYTEDEMNAKLREKVGVSFDGSEPPRNTRLWVAVDPAADTEPEEELSTQSSQDRYDFTIL